MGDGGEYGDVSSGNELLARSQSRGESSERGARGKLTVFGPFSRLCQDDSDTQPTDAKGLTAWAINEIQGVSTCKFKDTAISDTI